MLVDQLADLRFEHVDETLAEASGSDLALNPMDRRILDGEHVGRCERQTRWHESREPPTAACK